jgi:hypothetical protein
MRSSALHEKFKQAHRTILAHLTRHEIDHPRSGEGQSRAEEFRAERCSQKVLGAKEMPYILRMLSGHGLQEINGAHRLVVDVLLVEEIQRCLPRCLPIQLSASDKDGPCSSSSI